MKRVGKQFSVLVQVMNKLQYSAVKGKHNIFTDLLEIK